MKIDYPHHLAAHFNKYPRPDVQFDTELLGEIYRDPATGKWAERYVRFGYDPHEAYCELADGVQGHCPDCDAERIGNPTCTHCDAELISARPVDENGDLLRLEVDHRSEMDWEWFADWVNQYADSVPTTHLKIEGSNLGWRRASGHKVCEAGDLLDALTINTDATYACTHDKQTGLLHVTRSHHDAPTGESLTVTPGNLCDVTDEFMALTNERADILAEMNNIHQKG